MQNNYGYIFNYLMITIHAFNYILAIFNDCLVSIDTNNDSLPKFNN